MTRRIIQQTTKLSVANSDLGALFDIELVGAPASPDKCPKCTDGKFYGTYGKNAGKVLGDCFACKGTSLILAKPAPKSAGKVSVEAISKAFAAARANDILRPKLRLDTFIFSRAPDSGSWGGSIYVKEEGTYLGRVTGGEFFPTRGCDDETAARIIEVASDPHNAAKAYGMRFGICSCCGRTLTNGISVDLGIGPICREKFGW